MRLRVTPGGTIGGEVSVPGDKSISHRWLVLAATADGASRIDGLPRSLDVGSTAACLATLAPAARPSLEAWASRAAGTGERHGSTWNHGARTLDVEPLDLRAEGRGSLRPATSPLDCGNSGTTMRLLTGVLAASPFASELAGDESLSARPMERVARPLREMGADITTVDGHPPITVRGAALRGIRAEPDVPSAQVKSAILLAAIAASGTTTVTERVATRDHTERALLALGAPIRADDTGVSLDGPFQQAGFQAVLPGDPSSAAFLIAAAVLTGAELTIRGVGLNPTRLRFLEVFGRMGVVLDTEVEGTELGEPVGNMRVVPSDGLQPVRVGPEELPLVVDEVPVLASLAAHATGGPSRFEGGSELRLKESDRLAALVEGLRSLGGEAFQEGDDLIVEGSGLAGGTASGAGDHRIAMALSVCALAARTPSEIRGIESAEVSFPGFARTLAALGAEVEETP